MRHEILTIPERSGIRRLQAHSGLLLGSLRFPRSLQSLRLLGTLRSLRPLFLLLLTLLALPVLIPGNALQAQCWILLWQDEFEGDAVDPEKWNVVDDPWGGGNQELQYYSDRDTNVHVEDGWLIIRALKENYLGKEYTSGKLTTKGLADWRYGRIEARIRLPEGQGIWPAFWMMPVENVYGTWPNSGEIDIMEMIGNEPATVYGTLHYGPPHYQTGGGLTLPEGRFSDSAFVFAIEWDEDRIDWYVNDIRFTFKTPVSLVDAELWKVFRERFYLIMNLAVGGIWPGNPDETTVFPQTMEVDYVRAYCDPAQLQIIAADSAIAGAKGVHYSFMEIPGATYTWTVPGDAEIVGGQGTREIVVDWGCMEGDVQLTLGNTSCGEQVFALPVVFGQIRIAGPSQLLPLESALFSVFEQSGTEYTWTFPGDAEALNEPGDTLELRWGCGDGYVVVNMANACESEKDSVWVSVRDPVLSGPARMVTGAEGVPYVIEPIHEATYNWSVPPDASVAGGQGTGDVTVDFGAEGGMVSVEVTSSCGTAQYALPVHVSDTVVIVDFEDLSYDFSAFADADFIQTNNPLPDAVNPSPTVGRTYKSEVTWAGIYADLGYNLDLETHKKFLMTVRGPVTGEVRFKLEDSDGGSGQTTEVWTDLTAVNKWQVLGFPFPGVDTDLYDRITLFFDFGSDRKNYFYFDNILLVPGDGTGTGDAVTAPPATSIFPNPSGDRLTVVSGGIMERVEVYSMTGSVLLGQSCLSGLAELDLSGVAPGVCMLRVIYRDGNSDYIMFVKK